VNANVGAAQQRLKLHGAVSMSRIRSIHDPSSSYRELPVTYCVSVINPRCATGAPRDRKPARDFGVSRTIGGAATRSASRVTNPALVVVDRTHLLSIVRSLRNKPAQLLKFKADRMDPRSGTISSSRIHVGDVLGVEILVCIEE
jgi:hypothetical protein